MNIPENVESKYRFIVLAGERVAQLQKGARPRIDDSDGQKYTRIAVAELEDGKLDITDRPSEAELEAQRAEEEKAKEAKEAKPAEATEA